MNSKIVAAFLLVTITGVLAHPHHLARDDAVAAPVAVAQAAVPLSASSAAPEVTSAAPIPEEQPTSQALLDDATGNSQFLIKYFALNTSNNRIFHGKHFLFVFSSTSNTSSCPRGKCPCRWESQPSRRSLRRYFFNLDLILEDDASNSIFISQNSFASSVPSSR